MKTAEQMMIDWMQSQLRDNQTFTINSEQYLNIWNHYQNVELTLQKAEYMRYAKRTDENHGEIRDGLRQAGYVVKDLSRCGEGVPDLLVAGSGRGVMFEIKYGNAKLTDAEKEFHEMFHGLGVYIVRTLEQALEIMRRETI